MRSLIYLSCWDNCCSSVRISILLCQFFNSSLLYSFDLSFFLFTSSGGVEMWLRYIRFELDHGDANRVGNLHYRAKLALDSQLADEFLTQYTLMQLTSS